MELDEPAEIGPEQEEEDERDDEDVGVEGEQDGAVVEAPDGLHAAGGVCGSE